MHDLQVKGVEHASNLWMLDKNVNELLGRQVRQQIMKLPDHTPITKIIIKGLEK